jgi:hypothetical protein
LRELLFLLARMDGWNDVTFNVKRNVDECLRSLLQTNTEGKVEVASSIHFRLGSMMYDGWVIDKNDGAEFEIAEIVCCIRHNVIT